MPGDALLPRKIAFSVFCLQWAYWTTLAAAAWSWHYMPAGVIRSCLVLIPVLLALFIVGNTYWIYDACDEFIRLRILKCVVITAIVVSSCTLGYFFMELVGFPRLSMLTVNFIGWSIFNLLMLHVIVRSQR